MKKYCLIPFFLLFVLYSNGQSSFSVSPPDTVYAEKPANLFVFYNYIQFENLSGDTLPLRWIKREVIKIGTGHGGGSTSNWTTAIHDPLNYYETADNLDSAEFVLPIEAGTTDKFIFQLFPNNTPGQILASFVFFPVDNPADSVNVVFNYTALPVFSDVNNLNLGDQLSIYPNPAKDFFNINNKSDKNLEVQLFNASGQEVQNFQLLQSENKLVNTSHLAAGSYYLKINQNNQIETRYLKLVK